MNVTMYTSCLLVGLPITDPRPLNQVQVLYQSLPQTRTTASGTTIPLIAWLWMTLPMQVGCSADAKFEELVVL